tara:strand:- start:324 stop:914 length:591 start_codon:yes stop_codon:yes gene_type:complete
MKNFKPIYLTALLVLSFLLNSQNLFANTSHLNTDKSNSLSQAIAIDVLIGEDNVSGIRLSYRPHTYTIVDVPYFITLDVYWELSANFWEYGADNQHETNYALALSPVFGNVFYHVADKYPLRWEFGIGVSLVDDTRFAGKDIGSHYQFEDRLGLSMAFGDNLQQIASIRYMHYSNGGLNSKNPGMDFLNMAYSFKF